MTIIVITIIVIIVWIIARNHPIYRTIEMIKWRSSVAAKCGRHQSFRRRRRRRRGNSSVSEGETAMGKQERRTGSQELQLWRREEEEEWRNEMNEWRNEEMCQKMTEVLFFCFLLFAFLGVWVDFLQIHTLFPFYLFS